MKRLASSQSAGDLRGGCQMRISMRIVAVLVLVLGICLFLGKLSSVRGAPTQILVAIGNRDGGDYLWAVDANGTIYRSFHGGADPFLVVGQLPTTAPPVSICVLTFDVFIALSNGDVYDVGASSGPVTPVFIQNVFGGGPTSLSPTTWGKLKFRFGH